MADPITLHPFRALVLQPGLTPGQISTLHQVARMLVAETSPVLAATLPGFEAEVLQDMLNTMTAPALDATARRHCFGAPPGQTYAALVRLAAVAIEQAETIARNFDLAADHLGLAAAQIGSSATLPRIGDRGTLPCDTEPAP